MKEEETSVVATVTPTANNTIDTVTVGQLPAAIAPPCPSIPQDRPDTLVSQSEKEESEQGEEPAGEAAVSPVRLDEEKNTCVVQEQVNKMAPGQEVQILTSPPTSSPEKLPPASSPRPAPAEEDDRSTPLFPRLKGRRANLRESGSETPPRMPLCAASTSPTHMASPPRSVLKRQDEPMVVLHCLPTQHLHSEVVLADSDTDSATEEEEEAGTEERSSSALKRKTAEQRAVEKKLRPDIRQEAASPPKTLPAPPKMTAGASPKALSSPLVRGESERRSEGAMKAEEWPHPSEEMPREVLEEHLTGAAMKEPVVPDGTPLPAAEAPGPTPAEELEPQIGPEALVCHEVDLDDLDDKEKPSAPPEHLLLMMREQQQAPPPPPNLPQPQVRTFLSAATPSSASCPEELHPARGTAEEERGATRVEHEGDSSASSSTSLQESQDRGKTPGFPQPPLSDWSVVNP